MRNLIVNTYGAFDLVDTELNNLRAAYAEAKRRGDAPLCAMIARNISELERLRAA